MEATRWARSTTQHAEPRVLDLDPLVPNCALALVCRLSGGCAVHKSGVSSLV